MASTSRIGAVLTFLLVATWVVAPVPTWLSTPAAAQKKKEDEKAAKKKAKADPKGTKDAKDPKAAAAEKAAKEKAKAKALKDAAKAGKIPAASINKSCCYSEKAKCEGACGFTGGDRSTACRQDCEGYLRNCLGAGVFMTPRGSQIVCAKR